MSRLFELVRSRDVSGVSGTGVVAEGVEYTDGSVAVRWKGNHPATAVWPSLADVLAVHGHQGDTVVRWVDQRPLDGIPGAMAKASAVIAAGMPYININVNGKYHDERGVRIHASGADGLRAWIAALGGSVADAVRSDWTAGHSYVWTWTEPGGLIRCFHLTNDPGDLESLEAVSDADAV